MVFPTNELHVETAERELGVKLPTEFRERLLARNGGELSTAGDDWRVFPVLDANRTAGRAVGHMVQENHVARARDGFPQGAIAIAGNGAGDLLVLMPKGPSGRLDPQVFVWSHETRKCTPAALRYED